MAGIEFASPAPSLAYASEQAAARLLQEVVASSASVRVRDVDAPAVSSRSRSGDRVEAVIDRMAFIELMDQALTRSRSDRVAIVCAVVEGWDSPAASLSGPAARACELVTGRLRKVLREGDVLASVGRGAFAVLSVGPPDMAASIAERMDSALHGPLALPSGLVRLTARVGVTLADYGDRNSQAVLGRAEQATRKVLQGGGDGWFKEPQIDERAEVDTLVNELFAAGLLVASCRRNASPLLTERLDEVADLLDGTIARLASSGWAKFPAQRRQDASWIIRRA